MTGALLELEPDTWTADPALDLTSHDPGSRAALPVLIRGGGGGLIDVSSVNALRAIGEFGYGAAKAGLINPAHHVAVTYDPGEVLIR